MKAITLYSVYAFLIAIGQKTIEPAPGVPITEARWHYIAQKLRRHGLNRS